MITKFINEIVQKKITISQALIHAKLFADKFEDKSFVDWLIKEINGYENDDLDAFIKEQSVYRDTNAGVAPSGIIKLGDPILPLYRRVSCNLIVTTSDIFGLSEKSESMFFPESDEYVFFNELMYHHNVIEGITTLEEKYLSADKYFEYEISPEDHEEIMFLIMKTKFRVRRVKKACQQFEKIKIKQIIDFTTQRLIDALVEIDKKFPDLKNQFIIPMDEKNNAHTIITNNVYGNHAPVNVAAGEIVYQSDIKLSYILDGSKLRELGVGDLKISELEQILQKEGSDKANASKSIVNWLADVTSAIAASGLYENIPKIVEYVNSIVR